MHINYINTRLELRFKCSKDVKHAKQIRNNLKKSRRWIIKISKQVFSKNILMAIWISSCFKRNFKESNIELP